MNPADKQSIERQNIAVEYAHGVLDEIRAHVAGNFERDLESGGVLFGTHSRRIVTVTAMRPAECSYGSGPVFVLSPADHREFEQIVALPHTEPPLEGLEPVGWFLSHVRDSLVLRPADREIFDRYFQQQWQMVLVMRPGQVGSLRAATIGRDIDSRSEIVLNEFTIKQVQGAEVPSAAEPSPASTPPVVSVRVVARGPMAPTIENDVPSQSSLSSGNSIVLRTTAATVPFRQVERAGNRRKRWTEALVVACLLVLIVLAANVFLNATAPDTVGLQAFERDGVLLIEWNPDAKSVAHATAATLEIAGGSTTVTRQLTREELKRGLVAVIRKQADVTARLKLSDGYGKTKEEQTRYIGRPVAKEELPKPAPPPPVVAPRHDDSAAIRQELSQERQHTSELERRIKVLQTIINRRDGK